MEQAINILTNVKEVILNSIQISSIIDLSCVALCVLYIFSLIFGFYKLFQILKNLNEIKENEEVVVIMVMLIVGVICSLIGMKIILSFIKILLYKFFIPEYWIMIQFLEKFS